MAHEARDLAQIRFDNALVLFDEFVRATVKYPDAATLRGLEGRFAERLQIQPSYWSQIKSRSRQIGERLARQFEQLSSKPPGWLDKAPDDNTSPSEAPMHAPCDDDERFIVDLVLTYYRRHPERARARLLDLLGEALRPVIPTKTSKTPAGLALQAGRGDEDLWSKTRAAVAPLKRKR